MRNLRNTLAAVALVLLPCRAVAGERLLGTIVSAGGADTTNSSTSTPFFVPPMAKITIWCNAGGYVITDTLTAASATTALPVTANEKFPTSVGSSIRFTSTGNAAQGGAVVRIFGTAAITCYVFERTGTE